MTVSTLAIPGNLDEAILLLIDVANGVAVVANPPLLNVFACSMTPCRKGVC